MRHMKAGRTFNRDTNARKALFIGLAKNLIEKEQIKTTLPKAKDLRSVVEKLITRAKVDTVANRRLVASELGNGTSKTVNKLFSVLGPRYAKRPGGYTRVLKAGFRYGDTYLVKNGFNMTEKAVSIGVEVPFKTMKISNLNLALEYCWRGTLQHNLIKENYVKLSIGVMFFGGDFDYWFVKKKFK